MPELAQVASADAVRLTTGDSLHAAMLGASQIVTASAVFSTTLPGVDAAPALEAPLAEEAIWAGDSFTETQTATLEGMPAGSESMFGYKPPLSLELLLDVQPSRAKPGDVLSYRLVASHTGREPLADITMDIPTPRGLVYVAGSATGFSYSPSDQRLTWRVAALQPGEALTGSFQLRATGLAMGELATVQARAASPLADGASLGSAVAEIVPPAADRVRVTPAEGGWLRSRDDQVEVKAPAGAVAATLLFSYRPAEGALPPGPRNAFDLIAQDEGGVPVARFQQPVTLVYPYRQAGVPTEEARGLAFFHLDEAAGAWRTLPTTIDPARGVLLAQSEHFSTFAVGGTDDVVESASYEFDPGSRIRAAQPQLFSGSIGFTYGFDLLPGRGGLTPALGLQYSSARHQRETGHFNHVGHGWDILGESYLMKADPSNPAGSKLTMVLNGASYTIDTTYWFVKEDPFIQLFWTDPTASDPRYRLNVRTQDGMLYTFQGYANITDDDNPWPPAGEPPMVFRWKTGQNNECGGFANLDWVKLPLVQVQDPSGNVIQYTWAAASTMDQGRHGVSDVRTDDHGCHYIRTVRLSEIRYNFEGATAQTRVKLRYDNGEQQGSMRYDRSDSFDQWGGMHLFAIYKLLGVDVVALNGSGVEQVVRQYNVNYYDQCAGGCDPNKGNTLLLPSQIVETAGGVSETTSFSYRDRNGVQNKTLSEAADYGYLGQMDNPYGGRSSFTAEVFDAHPGASRPPRVASYTMTDLVTNQPGWTWEYAAFTWEVDTHGYAQVNVLWPQMGDGVRRLEQHFFIQKVYLPGATTQIDHLAGREWKTVACLPASASPSAACASGGELTRSETDWVHTVNDMPINGGDLPAEQRPRFVYAQQSRSYRETLPMVRTDYGYEKDRQNGNQLGNLTYQQERLGSGPGWAATALRTTYTQYYPNLTYWVINKPAWSHFYEKCYDVPGQADPCDGGVIKSATRNYYDEATSPDVIVPNKGRLTRQEQGLDPVWQDTRYSYWSNGNLREVWRLGSLGHNKTETFYDSRFQAYPVCSKNLLGHTTIQRYYGVPGSGDPEPQQPHPCDNTIAGSNLPATGGFFGQLEQAIDENGQGTALQYDGLGRIWRVIRPGDNAAHPTLRFSYTAYSGQNAPFWIKKEQRENLSSASTGEYLETRTFYDGFGRVIQTQAEAAVPGQSIVASTQTNAAGQTLKQNAPYFHQAALGGYRTPDWGKPTTVTNYDAYSRVKQVTNPDTSKTCTYYQGLQTAVVYEQTAGGVYKYFQKISATDPLGRLSSVKDYMGTVGNNPGAACPAPAWTANPNGTTSYQYDVADRLWRTTGPDGAQITIIYDALGRKTQMSDPDMGTWTYGYDELGNLTRQTDARDQTICFYYNEVNQLLGKIYMQPKAACPADPGTYSVTFYYDHDENGLVANGKGRRTVMIDESGNTRWEYDARGRVTRETKVVNGTPNESFITQWTVYDAMDRVKTMIYPDGESVTFSYTSQGPLKGVSGTSVYVGDTLYNELGQVTDRYLGSTTGVIRQKYTYSAGENFRLTALQSGVSPNYNTLQNIMYSYDDQGNVLTVADAAAYGGSQTQTFTYDALNRLLTAQASGGSYGTYTQRSYVYNNAGNISTFEGAALGYNDAAHKHAVTHVSTVQKYWYDQNGNATRRVNGSQDVTLVYDAENRVTSISGSGINASYVYDGDGKRVKATVGSVTTVYIGNIYERDNGTTVRKYYYAGAVRVAMRTGGNTFYLLNDHLTSTAITTNSSGVRQTELRYFAYGGARYNPGGQMTIYRYTGQRVETGTGLYDYGARWYDPQIGRFLAPDSIVPNPGDSQSLNRYMYVLGNPLRYIDPTGHTTICGEACEAGYNWTPPRPGSGNRPGAGQPAGGANNSRPSGTPASTPSGCNSVLCLPTATPTTTPTATPGPGPYYRATTPTPSPTPTATPWPYTRKAGQVNAADLYWGLAYGLTVSLPEAVDSPTILRALGRGMPETIGGPFSAMVGWAVSVLPNEYMNVTQGASLRETLTDIVVDSGGYIFSTVAGAAAGGGTLLAGSLVTQGQVEIAAPFAVLTEMGMSGAASIAWDLWIAPNYVHPFVYQHIPGWAQ